MSQDSNNNKPTCPRVKNTMLFGIAIGIALDVAIGIGVRPWIFREKSSAHDTIRRGVPRSSDCLSIA